MIEDALNELKKAVNTDPANREARYNLAYVYEVKGMIDEAVAEYKKVIDANSNEPEKNKLETVNKQEEAEQVIVTR